MFSTSTKQNTKHAANKTVRRILSWIGMKKMHHRVHKLVLVLTSVWQKYSYFEFFFLCFNFSKFYTTSMFYLCKKKVKWYLGGLWTCWSSSSRTLDFLCASLFTVSMPSCWNQRCFFSPLPLSKVWKGRTFWCNMREQPLVDLGKEMSVWSIFTRKINKQVDLENFEHFLPVWVK